MNQYYKNAPHGGAFFETAQKGQGPFWAKGLQSAARIICPLMADKFHTCRLRSFLPGTRPGKKWIKFDLPPAGGKLCEAFLG
ncbi:MAG: hypothetical protein ACLR5H_11545 [Oscillospiraceae bacterium]